MLDESPCSANQDTPLITRLLFPANLMVVGYPVAGETLRYVEVC